MQLSKRTKLVLVKAAQATGTTAVETDVVDTAGYEGVMFFGSIATQAAGNFASAQQGDESDGSDAADLEGTKLVTTTNGDSFQIDIYRPRKRYVQATITRGTTTITGDVYALLYGPRVEPTSQGATIDSEAHVSPAEGTA